MSIVRSLSVGDGDMFYIKHNTDNFTIIDCSMSLSTRAGIVAVLKSESEGKGIRRFISTHPDDDHVSGLVYLDDQLPIPNFYCVQNAATKDEQTSDFDRYCSLRDSTKKAFHIYKGCSRRWMNRDGQGRWNSGINVLWPSTDNAHYVDALHDAALGLSPNNISAVVKYHMAKGPSFLWMGDLETTFMENIEGSIASPEVDILFAPHHGRDSGRVRAALLNRISPQLIVIGEAPAEHLNYYSDYNTITQNSAHHITFACVEGWAHVYVSSATYAVDFLGDWDLPDSAYGRYIGSLSIRGATG